MADLHPAHRDPRQTRDAWNLKCTCTASNRYATWHDSTCDLFQKFPTHGVANRRPRRTGYALEQS